MPQLHQGDASHFLSLCFSKFSLNDSLGALTMTGLFIPVLEEAGGVAATY